MASPTEAVIDETVLGTPVPVAHSTISQKTKQRTYLVTNPNLIPVALPALEQSTDTLPASPQIEQLPEVMNSDPSKTSPSILNIESMKGAVRPLQGGTYALTPRTNTTNPVPGVSFEETEAETRQIEFDEAELKCLEDAFSDLDSPRSEMDATLPTKACAALSTGHHALDQDNSVPQYDNSATTISSLHSALDDHQADKTLSNGATSASCSDCAIQQTTGPSESVSPINNEPFSHLPSLTGLSSILEKENAVDNESITAPSSQTSTTQSNPLFVNVPLPEHGADSIPQIPADSPVDACGPVEQSTTLVSCLHMSDVDGLLDYVGTDRSPLCLDRRLEKDAGLQTAPLLKQLNRQTVARLRAVRPRNDKQPPTPPATVSTTSDASSTNTVSKSVETYARNISEESRIFFIMGFERAELYTAERVPKSWIGERPLTSG
ncbi:unnamed protein product [Echinostoma caproni]|uniref:Pecanex-like protein n=1 Tax=Echinostoma caproni TaxID=27848 RepID=A0A183ACW5_9TREM|nr:unnamed protein product [Echinostoma caproni]